ncbi:hypothetical protein [Secundilactobacillus muriivasis]
MSNHTSLTTFRLGLDADSLTTALYKQLDSNDTQLLTPIYRRYLFTDTNAEQLPTDKNKGTKKFSLFLNNFNNDDNNRYFNFEVLPLLNLLTQTTTHTDIFNSTNGAVKSSANFTAYNALYSKLAANIEKNDYYGKNRLLVSDAFRQVTELTNGAGTLKSEFPALLKVIDSRGDNRGRVLLLVAYLINSLGTTLLQSNSDYLNGLIDDITASKAPEPSKSSISTLSLDQVVANQVITETVSGSLTPTGFSTSLQQTNHYAAKDTKEYGAQSLDLNSPSFKVVANIENIINTRDANYNIYSQLTSSTNSKAIEHVITNIFSSARLAAQKERLATKVNHSHSIIADTPKLALSDFVQEHPHAMTNLIAENLANNNRKSKDKPSYTHLKELLIALDSYLYAHLFVHFSQLKAYYNSLTAISKKTDMASTIRQVKEIVGLPTGHTRTEQIMLIRQQELDRLETSNKILEKLQTHNNDKLDELNNLTPEEWFKKYAAHTDQLSIQNNSQSVSAVDDLFDSTLHI